MHLKLTFLFPDNIKSYYQQPINSKVFFEINSDDIALRKLKQQSKLLPSSQCALGYHPRPNPLFFAKHPLKSANCPSLTSFLGNSVLYISFYDLCPSPRNFSKPANIKNFSSLTPSHLLKVISLVKRDKNIFVHYIFQISACFLCKNCDPTKKSHPYLCQQPPSEILVSQD